MITLMAVHILGCGNVRADHFSRLQVKDLLWMEQSTEWSLDQRTALHLFDIWGQPTVDLFATRANTKVEAFVL